MFSAKVLTQGHRNSAGAKTAVQDLLKRKQKKDLISETGESWAGQGKFIYFRRRHTYNKCVYNLTKYIFCGYCRHHNICTLLECNVFENRCCDQFSQSGNNAFMASNMTSSPLYSFIVFVFLDFSKFIFLYGTSTLKYFGAKMLTRF